MGRAQTRWENSCKRAPVSIAIIQCAHSLPPPTAMSYSYASWVLDVPKLLDLCALYGRTHATAISAMLHQLVTLHSLYYGDVAEALPLVSQVLAEVAGQVEAQGKDTTTATNNASPGVSMVDLHQYLVDVTTSIHELLQAHPDMCYCLMRGVKHSVCVCGRFWERASAHTHARCALYSCGKRHWAVGCRADCTRLAAWRASSCCAGNYCSCCGLHTPPF